MKLELPPLMEHMELHFGKIERGIRPDEPIDPSIQVVEFRQGKIPGVTVLSTLGLSNFEMQSPVSEKQIRQELFVMMKNGQLDSRLPPILDQLARERVRADTPVLRGEIIQKENPILERGGRDFVGFYATLPIYYPDSFRAFKDDPNQVAIGFLWLLPIEGKELLYAQRHGWSAFEELLNKANFDLFDLDRPGVV